MLTPDYLTINQSEECPQADHAPHNPVFKNLSLKAIREFRFWSISCPHSLFGSCNKHCTFLHHNPVSVDWLYCVQENGPKFDSVTLVHRICVWFTLVSTVSFLKWLNHLVVSPALWEFWLLHILPHPY